MPNNPNIIFLTGHTASGKTDFVFSLFKDFFLNKKQKTFIVNSDAYQIYKDITLISTQPNFNEFLEKNSDIRKIFQKEEELKKYFLLYNCIEITERFSVYQMINLIKEKFIFCLENDAENIIITGGSPMYMRLLIDGINENHLNNKENLKELEADQETTLSKDLVKENFDLFLKKNFPSVNFNIKKQILYKPRDVLYKNCEKRFDSLIESGVLEEVRLYLDKIKNFEDYKTLTSYKTLGIQEIEMFLDKKLSLQEISNKIKQKTRNYIKHQDTWFRNKFKDFEFISG